MKQFNRFIDEKNITIKYILGQNAIENHQIIDDADKNDWWFHLTDFPSGHCIVETDNLDKEDIIYASQLVKENSKYKNINKVSVSYLQIKDIKKTKKPGEVKLLKKANKIIL
tara:strand:- start:148 stop:483 length:336 start_codon:yes stop_codon:yes gene_type:complete